MPLQTAVLKATIENALNEQSKQPSRGNPKTELEKAADDQILKSNSELAEALSKAIEAFVKSGTVNTTVVTSGSPSSHTGTGVGNIT